MNQKYHEYVQLNQLVALQTNEHKRHTHLKYHVDEGRNDGFGVVVATFMLDRSYVSKHTHRGFYSFLIKN